MNTHLFHTLVETVNRHRSRIWKAPYNPAQEFHVYGLEWDPEVLGFTVDGDKQVEKALVPINGPGVVPRPSSIAQPPRCESSQASNTP